ncbi:MAG: small basic protein [Planctomycetota bacterium]
MSIDSSLKSSGGLANHRNVLTRAERIAKLQDKDKFDGESDSPLGLPKVGNLKIVTGKTKKKSATEES